MLCHLEWLAFPFQSKEKLLFRAHNRWCLMHCTQNDRVDVEHSQCVPYIVPHIHLYITLECISVAHTKYSTYTLTHYVHMNVYIYSSIRRHKIDFVERQRHNNTQWKNSERRRSRMKGIRSERVATMKRNWCKDRENPTQAHSHIHTRTHRKQEFHRAQTRSCSNKSGNGRRKRAKIDVATAQQWAQPLLLDRTTEQQRRIQYDIYRRFSFHNTHNRSYLSVRLSTVDTMLLFNAVNGLAQAHAHSAHIRIRARTHTSAVIERYLLGTTWASDVVDTRTTRPIDHFVVGFDWMSI